MGFSVNGLISRWARRKTYGLEEADPLASSHGGPATLAKVLNTFDLTLLGVGSTLGVGIYVLAGSVAYDTAGPAVCLSFLVAAIASAFAAMSYAEFGARVPKAGSAYIYSYVTVGEFIAFVIGWNLILEYLIGTASVARAFSANLDALTDNAMSNAFKEVFPINASGLSEYADFFCLGITLVLAVLLGLGVRSSAIFTNVFTFVNITVVLFVIIGGSINANPANWRIPESDVPAGFGVGGFFPYGLAGVMAGAAKCFFAFVGFDSIASTGEEAKNAKRSIPFSINLTLIIVFIAYFGVSTVITLMVPYYEQDSDTPLVSAFEKIGWYVASWTITIGSLFGLAASLLGAMIPLPRILYAKAKDGLIFRFLAYISPRFQTPVIATAISGVLAAILGAIFDLDALVDMMSIGTLLAYTLVSLSVLILRYEEAEEQSSSSIETSTRSSSNDVESTSSQHRRPTKTTSRNAVIATVIYCAFTIAFCALLVVLEDNTDPLLLLGLGICVGPMLLLILYLIMLPRSNEELYFKVPGVPVVPCLSVIINTYLMCKLDYNTWIRFGVWMAVGFLMYFGYGMWNSSEEYVRRGKIPPGGTSPLPSSAARTNKVEEKPEAKSVMANGDAELDGQKRPLSRAIPITSFDEDKPSIVTAEVQQEPPVAHRSSNMTLLIHTSHQDAQDVFDQARSKRKAEEEQAEKAAEEMARLAQAMIQTHQMVEKVFHDLKQDREKEDEEHQKQMNALAQQVDEVHQQLDKIFKRPIPFKRTSIRAETKQMNAVLQELKAKSEPIDADEDFGYNKEELPTDASLLSAPEGATASSTPSKDSEVSNSSSTLMLTELKRAFNEALKATSGGSPDEADDEAVVTNGNVISPKFVQELAAAANPAETVTSNE